MDNEFVCPFTVGTNHSLPKPSRSARSSVSSGASSIRPSYPNSQSDTILSNRAIIIWTSVKPGITESKSVSLRGNGSYRVEITGMSSSKFTIYQNNCELLPRNRVMLKSGTDALITVKFNSGEESDQFIAAARVSFISDQNAKLKSTIPLLVLIGNPLLSLNGEEKKKKINLIVEREKEGLKIKNVGHCPAFAYIINTKVTDSPSPYYRAGAIRSKKSIFSLLTH